MIKHFLSLEWKQFKRASYFQKGLAIKILLFLAVLYFGGIAVFMGGAMFFILKKAMPEIDPIVTVNNFLVYWVLGNFVIRVFYATITSNEHKAVNDYSYKKAGGHSLFIRQNFNFLFNIVSTLIFLPFCIVLLAKGYPLINVISWFLSLMILTLVINYTNFLINKNNTVFYGLITVLAAFIGLEIYDIYKISEPIGLAFNALYNNPYLIVIPLLLLSGIYKVNFNFIRKGFYLDGTISKKAQKINETDLTWMNRFGTIAPFLKNDIKMISRNARPKQVVMMSVLFLFYGVIFYTQDVYKEMPAMLAFASMFVTGGFLMTFGQLVPSWDSEYYKLLMSQNIPYKKYLESKWYLMVVGVTLSFILSVPYIYFGWEIFGMIAAGALFNIGLNTFITLFGGALNRVPIELNTKAKAFSNTNGFNPTQLLIALPKFILPMLLFYVPYKLINFNAGLIVLALSGVLGIVFRNYFLNKIEGIYQKGKYKTIAAFAEKK